MKMKWQWIVFVAVVSLFGTNVYAESFKIGWVNQIELMQNAPQVEAARKKLENEFSSRQRELIAMDEDLRALREKYEQQRGYAKEELLREMERTIMSRERDAKRAERELKEDISIRQNEVQMQLRQEILQLIETFAKKNGFDLILTEGAAYASSRIDITESILKSLADSVGPAGGSAAPSK
jgi:outer membrane protein